MKESTIQRGIIDYLQTVDDIYYFRSAAGSVQTAHGRFFKTGRPGCPDISVVYRGTYYGIEVKTKSGYQTNLQKHAEEQIKKAGGQYHIARSVSDVKKIIK